MSIDGAHELVRISVVSAQDPHLMPSDSWSGLEGKANVQYKEKDHISSWNGRGQCYLMPHLFTHHWSADPYTNEQGYVHAATSRAVYTAERWLGATFVGLCINHVR